jgi:hypothetical protein
MVSKQPDAKPLTVQNDCGGHKGKYLSKAMKVNLHFLCKHLCEPKFSPLWSQQISLLMPQLVVAHKLLSDVSYEGLGGWLP